MSSLRRSFSIIENLDTRCLLVRCVQNTIKCASLCYCRSARMGFSFWHFTQSHETKIDSSPSLITNTTNIVSLKLNIFLSHCYKLNCIARRTIFNCSLKAYVQPQCSVQRRFLNHFGALEDVKTHKITPNTFNMTTAHTFDARAGIHFDNFPNFIGISPIFTSPSNHPIY